MAIVGIVTWAIVGAIVGVAFGAIAGSFRSGVMDRNVTAAITFIAVGGVLGVIGWAMFKFVEGVVNLVTGKRE